ncbi:hypothetical protein Lalb_Chr19g0139671 [Lupinus albus]|uniref:Uncharacterized protein n=1 Tax=Lupinus albus TaxID=3870 RepID=A0A6A4NVV1_LUPAL|nr:hypothetical protein Lalb_Chr19g0139671 [Lupinus albus]
MFTFSGNFSFEIVRSITIKIYNDDHCFTFKVAGELTYYFQNNFRKHN